jgi:hypothetical protein
MTKIILERINIDTYEPVEPVELDTESEEFKEAALQWLTEGRTIPTDNYW